jgi:hypothetical protein
MRAKMLTGNRVFVPVQSRLNIKQIHHMKKIKGFTSFSTVKVGDKFTVGKVEYQKVCKDTAIQVTSRQGVSTRKGFKQTDGVMVLV